MAKSGFLLFGATILLAITFQGELKTNNGNTYSFSHNCCNFYFWAVQVQKFMRLSHGDFRKRKRKNFHLLSLKCDQNKITQRKNVL